MREYPIITRARIAELGQDDSTATDEEKEWFAIMRSEAPELQSKKRRIGVCTIADVISITRDSITVAYEGTEYTLNKPVNALRIARAREYGATAALEELNAQRQIKVNGAPINKDFSNIDASVILGLTEVADSFFFKPFF